MKTAFLSAIFMLAVSANATITSNDALPTKILTCGGSIITDIGGRLEGDKDFSSGVDVLYKNQGSSVSYDKIDAVAHSKVGDHVMICLVYLPSPCPPGDDRGKVYTVTNLRTLESWTLPDTEHSCGGA